MTITRAQQKAKERKAKADAGMVRFDRWVTPQQDAAIRKMLAQWKETE